MQQKYLFLLLVLSVTLPLFSCGGSSTTGSTEAEAETETFTVSACDSTSIDAANYLMSFHSCSNNCSDPTNHTVQLAKSDDGIAWLLVEEFTSFDGSVPDLIYYKNYLYVFVPGEAYKYDACFQKLAKITYTVESDEDDGIVDPSLYIDGDDLLLYYLPSVSGSDPASCSTSPCTKEIHSMSADDTSLETWTQIGGNRVSVTLDKGGMSDPDIIVLPNGDFAIYTSSGQNTWVFTNDDLEGIFTAPEGGDLNVDGRSVITSSVGGVPGAITVGDEVWIYVTSSNNDQETIKRAVSDNGISEISDEDFSIVVDDSISTGFSTGTNASSPSVIVWPDDDWVESTGST